MQDEIKKLTHKIEIAYEKAKHAEEINKRLVKAVVIVPVTIVIVLCVTFVLSMYFIFVANNYPDTIQEVTPDSLRQEIKRSENIDIPTDSEGCENSSEIDTKDN